MSTLEHPSPWLVLCPTDVHQVHGLDPAHLDSVPSGGSVVLSADTVLARIRLRRLAARNGIDITRELIAVPSTRNPVAVIDDHEEAVRQMWQLLGTVPPGVCHFTGLIDIAIRVAKRAPWAWTGAIFTGRIVIGVRR